MVPIQIRPHTRKEKKTLGTILTDIVIQVSSPLVILVSVALLVFVFLLAIYLPRSEKEALIAKTDDFCISTAMGLSSVTIQGITYKKREIISDYLGDISKQKIQGLTYAEVIEYKWKKDRKRKKVLAGGVVIGSLKVQNTGKSVSSNDLVTLTNVTSFSKTVISNKPGNILEYTYPIVWNARLKGVKQHLLVGAVRLRFSEKAILQSYYKFRDFSNQLAATAAVSSVIIVYFYLVLVSLLRKKIREIREMSLTDALTKIYNRKKFNEALEKEMQRSKRYRGQLSLIMFDIDHFKAVNDTYGHDAGDSVLFTVARIVGKAVRNTDLFARWGGEEFMILAPNTGGKEAALFAERVRKTIEESEFEIVKKITCSFGVTAFIENDSEELLLGRADTALYRSKETGRNRVSVNL